MKKLSLLALLASCTSSPTETLTQQAVSAYLRKTVDDPSSYRPVSWSTATPYTKEDADHALGKEKLQASANLAKQALDYQTLVMKLTGNQLPIAKEESSKWQKQADEYSRASDSAKARGRILASSTDTTRIGVTLTHAYRAKNKAAALVLDSARFIVLKNSAVIRQEL